MNNLFLATGVIFFLFLSGFALTCFLEKEVRAAWIMTGISIGLFFFWFGFGIIFPESTFFAAWAAWALVIAGFVLLAIPLGTSEPLKINGKKTQRLDERDVIFGRMALAEGNPQYKTYYSKINPGMKRFDDHLRSMPDLGDPGSEFAHPLDSPYAKAIFRYIAGFNHLADPGAPEAAPVKISPAEASRRIKGFGRYLGALDVRITRLKDYHVYSHAGRHNHHWGDPIAVDYPNAIVFSLEMKHEMIQTAPQNAAFTETADKYMKAADVGICLANYINELGYRARAHVDASYQVLCTALAHDAGLGELGRLGLIVTPEHGPRVRLAAVTTDIPLEEDSPIDIGVQHFCTICKKCADNCPSRSIEKEGKKEVNGVTKWQSNMESCFQYWKKTGTDCGLCIAVCPFSKPNGFYHNLIRFLSSRNVLARHIALFMDDLLYSRTPRHHNHQPEWFSKE